MAVHRRQAARAVVLAPVQQGFQFALGGRPPAAFFGDVFFAVFETAEFLLGHGFGVGDGQAVFLAGLALGRAFRIAAGAGVIAVELAAQALHGLHFPDQTGLLVPHAAGAFAGISQGRAVGCGQRGETRAGRLFAQRGQAQAEVAGGVVGGHHAAGDAGLVEQDLQLAGLGQALAAAEAGGGVGADLDAVVGIVVFVQRQQQLHLAQHGRVRRVLAAGQLQWGELGCAQAAAQFQLADAEDDGFAVQVAEFAIGGGFTGVVAAVVVQARHRAVDEDAGAYRLGGGAAGAGGHCQVACQNEGSKGRECIL